MEITRNQEERTPVDKDENDRLWKDVDPREGFLSGRNICSAFNNYFDG